MLLKFAIFNLEFVRSKTDFHREKSFNYDFLFKTTNCKSVRKRLSLFCLFKSMFKRSF